MKQPTASKSARDARNSPAHEHKTQRQVMSHPRSTPIISLGKEADQEADQPFVEGALDTIDPDLRHRMISETAYRRYIDRAYADGYDVDDWLQAEAEVEHLLLYPGPQSGP